MTMAYYAFLDENNIVTEVISGKDENELLDGLDPETWYGNFRGQRCLRTSYNTHGNQHLNGGTAFRKNFAGIGYRYDDELDAFIPPQPFPSWILNADTCLYSPPFDCPEDGKLYYWSESSLAWIARD